jgi:hypothetical protein
VFRLSFPSLGYLPLRSRVRCVPAVVPFSMISPLTFSCQLCSGCCSLLYDISPYILVSVVFRLSFPSLGYLPLRSRFAVYYFLILFLSCLYNEAVTMDTIIWWLMNVQHLVECELAGETEVFWEPLPPPQMPLSLPQFAHDLTWDRARAAAVPRDLWHGLDLLLLTAERCAVWPTKGNRSAITNKCKGHDDCCCVF